MTKRKYSWVLLLFAITGVVVVKAVVNSRSDDRLPIVLKTVKTAGGWGYDIFVDDKLFIHQINIPALEGQQSFATEAAAKQVGDKAVLKLKEGKMPAITRAELIAWNILPAEKTNEDKEK